MVKWQKTFFVFFCFGFETIFNVYLLLVLVELLLGENHANEFDPMFSGKKNKGKFGNII